MEKKVNIVSSQDALVVNTEVTSVATMEPNYLTTSVALARLLFGCGLLKRMFKNLV